MTARGVVQIAIGERAQAQQRMSAATLHGIPVTVITNNIDGMTPVQSYRHHKTHLDNSPYFDTLYLDADTRAKADVSTPFQALADGWDVCICPSNNQEVGENLWHVGLEEREATYEQLGYIPLQLQAGVIYYRRNERTAALFAAWRYEWARWQGQDQAALLRALSRAPVKIWLLGRPYNGGSVINHLFGAARHE